jgi:hypothetical protein
MDEALYSKASSIRKEILEIRRAIEVQKEDDILYIFGGTNIAVSQELFNKHKKEKLEYLQAKLEKAQNEFNTL